MQKEVSNKRKIDVNWKYIGLFVFFFIIQYKFLSIDWFGTDEIDIFLGGKTIAKGYMLYQDFLSQHMPVSYYFSAIFELLGATTVEAHRICFYLFYAFCWTIFYKRYTKYVGKYTLILFPVVFCGVISTYVRGTAVLSEHIAAIGLLFLFLEFIRFIQERELKWDNYLCISLSIVLSFGTLFIAAFPVAVIVVGVFAYETKWMLEDKVSFGEWMTYLWKKYLPLIIWVVAPWIILLVYYWLNDCLDIAFYSAYTLNREVYPKYLDGYGLSIIQTLLSIPKALVTDIVATFCFQIKGGVNIIRLLLYLLMFVYVAKETKKKGIIYSVIVVLLLCAASSRSCFDFHGTQFVALLVFVAMQVVSEVLIVDKETFGNRKLWYKGSVILLVCVFMYYYVSTFSTFVDVGRTEWYKQKAEEYQKNVNNLQGFDYGEYINGTTYTYAQYINCITEEDEAIWQAAIDFNTMVMLSDRPSLMNAASTPWTWEAFSDWNMERLEKEQPRVVIYNPGSVVWDYRIQDYAPQIGEYLAENYTNYPGSFIYIINDYYDEAYSKILELQQTAEQ